MNPKPHLARAAMLATCLGTALSLQAGTITDGMVVYLPFDNDYVNAAASTVTATPVGAPAFGAGKLGSGALDFSTDRGGAFFNYVTLGTPAELNFGGSVDFTVSMWVKFTTWTDDPPFISNKNWDSGGNAGWVLATGGDGRYQWNLKDGGSRKDFDGAPGTVSDGQWHHVAVSFARAGNAVTYLDGQLVDTQAIGPGLDSVDSGLPTNIGQDGRGIYTDNGGAGIADGMADDVGIWRRALSGFELGRIYRFGTNGVPLNQIPDPTTLNVISTVPAANQVDVRPDTIISATILDGTLPLINGSIVMKVNGATVTPSVNKIGSLSTTTYIPPTAFSTKSTVSVDLTVSDGVTPIHTSWQFVVADVTQLPGITGQWDFDNGDLSATIGQALDYRDGPGGTTQQGTRFGTTDALGLPPINGTPAKVMGLPAAATRSIGYIMHHGAQPNGDPSATKVNQWTIIMDILIPNANAETWLSFMQIDDPINDGNDGDLFAKFSGGVAGIGISGSYQGNLTKGEWHRVAFAVDSANVISKWIDGVKAADQTGWDGKGLNGRHALFPTVSLFSDEDGESQPSFVNSIQIRNYKMSDAALTALGGPTARGIPLVTGQWDFDNQSLAATVGFDLAPLPGQELDLQYTSQDLNGAQAEVLYTVNPPIGLIMAHGALANAGGKFLNQYSLIMDILFPASSTGYRSLFQTSTNFPATTDGDLFLNGDSGIGISGEYQGNVTADTWHRVAFTFDLTKRQLGKYIDGANVLTGPVGSTPLGTGPFQYLSASSGIVDGRWSLGPLAYLFNDEDGEVAPMFVNSIQIRPQVLTAQESGSLGGPSAQGIPVNIPEQPGLTIAITALGPTITWPLIYTDYILESATRLGPTADWATVDGVGLNRFEEYRDAPQFYRLRKVR